MSDTFESMVPPVLGASERESTALTEAAGGPAASSASMQAPSPSGVAQRAIHPEDRLLYSLVLVVLLILVGFGALSRSSLDRRLTELTRGLEDGASMVSQRDSSPEATFLVTQLVMNSARYDYAGSLTLARSLRVDTAFLVGALLGLLGAVIVVRRVRDTGSDLGVDGAAGFRVRLVSSSPGLVLSLLGSIIVVTAVLVKGDTRVMESPLLHYQNGGPTLSTPAEQEAGSLQQQLLEVLE